MPLTTVHKDITVATKKVQSAIVGGWVKRGWVETDPSDGVSWRVHAGADGAAPWPLTHAAYPSPRAISGDREFTERFMFEEVTQRALHPATDYAANAPHNFQVTEVRRIAVMDAKRFYTVPAHICSLAVDKLTHGAYQKLHEAEGNDDNCESL